jgi:long-chain fatty acid transport protein
MSTKRSLLSTVLAAGAIVSATAQAGGISLYEVGTADVGLAAAGYAARAQDAATVLTNPAGMTRLVGNHLTLGAQALHADLGFSIGDSTSPALGGGAGGNPIGWFPGGGVFYSHSVSPDLKLGIALTGNFGSAVKYDSGWAGRYYLQEGTLLGVSILPSIAWRVNDRLSLGASLNVMHGTFETKVAVNNIIGPDGQLSLEDNAWGVGANLGLLYELGPGSRFGITYTSPVDLDFRAPASFGGLAPGIQALLSSRGLIDANVDLGMTVPQGVMASVYHELGPRWAVMGNVGWQQWSQFGRVDVGVDSNDPVSLTSSLDFDDTWHVAVGTQFRYSDAWTFNAGVAYDSAFQDNARVAVALPANAVWRFGIGGQKQESPAFRWGWSLAYVHGGDMNVDLRGNVPVAIGGRGDLVGSFDDASTVFLAASLSWKFDK